MRKKILLAALLLTGCLFSMGAMGRVSAGVTVDGVDVGGLSYAEAERRVRICAPLQPAPLVIGTPAGDIDVSEELSCFDDLPRLLRRAKRMLCPPQRFLREFCRGAKKNAGDFAA